MVAVCTLSRYCVVRRNVFSLVQEIVPSLWFLPFVVWLWQQLFLASIGHQSCLHSKNGMGGAKKQFHSRSGNLYEFEFGIAKSYCSHIQEIGRELLHLASIIHHQFISVVLTQFVPWLVPRNQFSLFQQMSPTWRFIFSVEWVHILVWNRPRGCTYVIEICNSVLLRNVFILFE